MNKTKVVHLLLIFFFFICSPISAQTNEEKPIALATALTQLEQLYKLNFSFADENIKNKTLIFPSRILSVDELLVYLKFTSVKVA